MDYMEFKPMKILKQSFIFFKYEYMETYDDMILRFDNWIEKNKSKINIYMYLEKNNTIKILYKKI